MKRLFFILVVAISLAVGLSACKSDRSQRKSIAVSIPPHASLLREITGDSIDIVTLMQADANPEAFEVSVKDMRAVNDAALYLKAGNLPFESTITERISQSNPALRFVDLSDGIDLIYGTHSHDNSHNDNIADPHTWTSLRNLKSTASTMLEAVSEIDPANKDYYNANYQRLVARLDSVDNLLATRLTDIPSRSFLVWHPSLSYFARDYGLEQIAIGQDNKEMTPGQLRDTHINALDKGVRVMFIQQNFDARQAGTLADELDINIVQINPLDDDYLNQFSIIADALGR